jgi:hypothetical protein
MAEAIACLEGLKLAINLTYGDLPFDTDCNSLLKIFDPGSADRSPASIIAKEFHLLKPEDRSIKLVHVSRKVNGVAHNLAQMGRSELCGGVLLDHVPACMSELVVQDCKNSFSG